MDRRWLLGGLLLAGGIGLVAVVRRRPKLTENTRLLMFGDSMAQGLDPHIKRLAADAGIPYFAAAVPGTRIDQWSASQKLEQYLTDFQPTLTLVVLGTNDAYMSGDVAARQALPMEQLLQKLAAAGTEIMWIGPPGLSEHSGRAPDLGLLELLGQAPHYFDSAELEIPRGPDGLHPTTAGFGGWAGRIWSSLL